jgi:hypothetical protein
MPVETGTSYSPSRYVCAYKAGRMIMPCILSLSLFFRYDKHRLPPHQSLCNAMAYHDWSAVRSGVLIFILKNGIALHERNSNCSQNWPERTEVTLNFLCNVQKARG